MADFFGAGAIYATPLTDASGSAIALPSPVQIGILQNVDMDDSFDTKELYGSLQYPVDIGRGKGKKSFKAAFAQFNALLFNSVFYGQSLTSGYNALYQDLVGSIIPTGAGATSIAITPTAPAGGTSVFAYDLGVQDGNGNPYTRVASSPTSGQYSLTGSTYTFSSLDVGKRVFISYGYSNATNPSTGKVLQINNLPMGQVPSFSVQFFVNRFGNSIWRRFPNCVSTKLSSGFKNDDFTINNFEFSAFADSNNVVEYQSQSA
jgi:hypothetical protein